MAKQRNRPSKLEEKRRQIDAIDSGILELLNKRANLAIEVADIKRDSNLKIHSPEREREVIKRLEALNMGPFPDDALKVIFREIISASLSLEEPLKVAYFGPEGTFTHHAALRRFGHSAHFIPVTGIKGVFDEVDSGKAHYGIVPIENSNEGVVSSTLDMFMEYDLKISAEAMLEVSQNLLSKSGERKKVKRIFSHPQPFAQCKMWLESNMPGIPLHECVSTAKAAEIASKNNDAAAIASELAARLYDLRFIEKHIEDRKNNYTRFLVIAKTFPDRTGKDKTSILCSVKDRPGALYDLLLPFKEAGLNLSNIESRPSKRKAWEYIFFVDMEGHIKDKKVKKALDAVSEKSLYMKHLGSYPANDTMEKALD